MIITVPNPVLTTPAKAVKKIDKKILKIIKMMKKDLGEKNNPKGVGLAAPQIGVGLRIFITKPTLRSEARTFINPEIVSKSDLMEVVQRPVEKKNKSEDLKLEGCLSIVNIWGYLKRNQKVRLKFMDESGKARQEDFSGFMATIIQHEIDHLDGILFTQKVLEQGEKLYKIKKGVNSEEILQEIKV